MTSRVQEDVVILGGGPAGASSACLLASRERSPLVLEREIEPRHKMCGEFISVEAQGYLEPLGIDARALGGAPISMIRLALGREVVEAVLPFQGVGLTRRTLDEALLRKAEAGGARVRRGAVVRAVDPNDAAFDVSLRDRQDLSARTVFLATGKHDLHASKRHSRASGNDLIGFKMYWTLSPSQTSALESAVEILLFGGGYAGLQRVEQHAVNLCLLVKQSVFQAVGRSWINLLDYLMRESPHLQQRLDGATPLLAKPLTISNVPYGFMHRSAPAEPLGLFRLGDQVGVIPSFCGDGIAIALHTAQLAVMSYTEQGNAATEYHARARADIQGPIILASGLYDLSCMRLGRRALMAACQLYPGILGTVARLTRVQGRVGPWLH